MEVHDSKARKFALAQAFNWAGFVEKSSNGTEAIVTADCISVARPRSGGKWLVVEEECEAWKIEMMGNEFILRERAERDENIQYFFRGFELPFRVSVACSPYLTVAQKSQMDAEISLRIATVEFFMRFLNSIV